MMEAPRIALDKRPYQLAGILTIALLAAAFLGALFSSSQTELFQLAPTPSSPDQIIHAPDVIEESQAYVFHLTFYTAWVTFLLSMPAFCLVWFRNRSSKIWHYWLAFWVMGLVAMFVHLFVAIGLLYDWNWGHVLNDTVRVTIPIPDLILTAWWTLDVLLAWRAKGAEPLWVRVQRVVVHVALLVVFMMGMIKEGELLLGRLIGAGAVGAFLASIIVGVMRRQKQAA